MFAPTITAAMGIPMPIPIVIAPHSCGSRDIRNEIDKYVLTDMSVQKKITINPPNIKNVKVKVHVPRLPIGVNSSSHTKYPRVPYHEMTTNGVFKNMNPTYTKTVMNPGYFRFFGIIERVMTM